ncbi:thioesterase II family protein [Nonomuraea purpurea]|uniref:Thioesterase II family protein n=1 Tax=Nonomuraea purpurea TaxID=1849276 RepID=A0ABV8GPL1_9ACTN
MTDWFVPLSRSATGATRHVYAFPQAGGGCSTFAELADRLPRDIALWGLNLPGRQARFLEPPCTDLDALVGALASDLAGRDRPVLFGYCSGACLAFLVARRLRKDWSLSPPALIAASYPAPDRARPPTDLHALDSEAFWQEILSHGGVPARVAAEPDFRELFEPALRADYALLSAYQHTEEEPLDVPITMISGLSDPVLHAEDIDGWGGHTAKEFASVRVPGDHWLLNGDLTTLAHTIGRAA